MDTLVNLAVQVPALGLLSFVFLRVFEMVLNRIGDRMEAALAALDALAKRMDAVEDICLRILSQPRQ